MAKIPLIPGHLYLPRTVDKCPCTYLEKPCCDNCSCVHPYSSVGCVYCCVYGDIDQQREKAKFLKEVIDLGIKVRQAL